MSHYPKQNPQASAKGPGAPARAYLVGGGIASMAGAAFLIRDGDMPERVNDSETAGSRD